jgi:hypothetical protein
MALWVMFSPRSLGLDIELPPCLVWHQVGLDAGSRAVAGGAGASGVAPSRRRGSHLQGRGPLARVIDGVGVFADVVGLGEGDDQDGHC